MAEVVSTIHEPEQERVDGVQDEPAANALSAHLQTTLASLPNGTHQESKPVPAVLGDNEGLTSSPRSTSQTPRERSPDRLSPYTSAVRTKSAMKSPGLGSRLAEGQAAENTTQAQATEADSFANIVNGIMGSGRKSVQFTQGIQEGENVAPEMRSPAEEEKVESKQPFSLYSKLRALAQSQSFQHVRSTSSSSIGARTADDGLSPRITGDSGLEATVEEDSDADADAEESAPEGTLDQASSRKRRRRIKRSDGVETAPVSPNSPIHHFMSAHSAGPSNKPGLLRRATDSDAAPARQGISEDESRRQHGSTSPWKPRHPLRGLSYGNQRKTGEETPESGSRRPLNLLNLSTITSSRGDQSAGETPTKSRRRQLVQRGTTQSAAKWRQLKTTLRAFGANRKKEKTPDQQKSAELLAELAAGGPAALMIASMFQRDKHGARRIPILLEQLKVEITDSEVVTYKDAKAPTPNDRHIIFRVEMEYGSGINRMRWFVRRTMGDFVSLHGKYSAHYQKNRVLGDSSGLKQLPKLPREALPYARFFAKEYKAMLAAEEKEEATAGDADNTATDPERPVPRTQRSALSLGFGRRRSSVGSQTDTGANTPGGSQFPGSAAKRDARYAEKQRESFTRYLRQMIQFLLFRPEANRLCKFLEVSALGVRLAAEGSYHGKEGFLAIRSAKGLDFRRALTPSNIVARHGPKWFLVRHSYIVCVDSPEGMNIYDVFLFDSEFTMQSVRIRQQPGAEQLPDDTATVKKESGSRHRLKLSNSERKLKLLARNERTLHQFEVSIRRMVQTSPWAKENRFDSFAPVRPNCFAQWLVDGRDHMWVLSRALNQAKDVIYIHDWWLSPELYMRRPPAISQKWRLDRLLKRKAEQGVKIFIIVYRNIDAAIPIDSQYTKFSLLDLHPNIFVQRSPNQIRQNTFFWAHHEKICVVDHTVAFVGGIDLCFGRWDTPQHVLTDDKPTGFDVSEVPKDSDHCQLWPGKDYSNPRIQDFYALNKPYEEMYNRSQVPRMPWHDISMHVVGQPARDLTRHFVQRWNYILRQRKPTRPTPFLLPPPDFNAADLEALGLDGTCEVQILRSAGPWSLGTPDKTEHSIMNAYVKMIEESEHFVYMENQFFISSCQTEGATVYNKIGDALVERIIRASKHNEEWRAVIVIPLIPGFQNTVEQEGGTSVRLIMQYQYRSICRGDSSIFGRLRAEGIEPEDYIKFYSLRTWGKIGSKQTLVTEQLYIHAKCIVVDDRIALIGSANINERSMLGNRDSECAAVVRDTDMVWSKMNGKPYRVSRFAHTLRMRLMREHLGLDVDKIMEETQVMEAEHRKHMGKEAGKRPQSPDNDDLEFGDPEPVEEIGSRAHRGKELRKELLYRSEEMSSFNHDVDWEQENNPNLRANRKITEDHRVTKNAAHRDDVDGDGVDKMAAIEKAGFGTGRDTVVIEGGKEVLVADFDTEGKTNLVSPRLRDEQIRLPSYVMRREAPEPPLPPRPSLERLSTTQLGLPLMSQLPPLPELDDTDIGGPILERVSTRGSNNRHHQLLGELKKPLVDRDCMLDPMADSFIDDTWHTIAENNTKIYRAIFRCMPDNLVRDWDDYHQYVRYEQRFNQLQGNEMPADNKVQRPGTDRPVSRTGPPGVGTSGAAAARIKGIAKVPTDLAQAAEHMREKVRDKTLDNKEDEKASHEKHALRDWAADLNREQAERQGRDLTVRNNFPEILDEKSGLASVPEDSNVPRSSDGSETTRAVSSQSNTVPENANGFSHSETTSTSQPGPTVRRRRRTGTRSSRRDFNATDDILSIAEAEELLESVQGHLVEWPYDWLERVEAGSNWLFPFDQISPIEIYI